MELGTETQKTLDFFIFQNPLLTQQKDTDCYDKYRLLFFLDDYCNCNRCLMYTKMNSFSSSPDLDYNMLWGKQRYIATGYRQFQMGNSTVWQNP